MADIPDKTPTAKSSSESSSSKKKKKRSKDQDVTNEEASKHYRHFVADGVLDNLDSYIPIIYSDNYNISFFGLEKLHPFDSCKYKNVVASLEQSKEAKKKDMLEPTRMPTEEQLLAVHTKQYLDSLQKQSVVAQITEIPVVLFFPMFMVRSRVLNPFLFATSGSILAGHIAMKYGVAINLGGGFHHCSATEGGGFCAYSDITLSLRYLRQCHEVSNVMIIDLDAHQGNGHENDKLYFNDTNLYILDVYNPRIYPGDHGAKAGINTEVHVRSGTGDDDYLRKLKAGLDKSFQEFKPQVIYYNAGTDILDGDPLGNLAVTAAGVVSRDEMVFQYAKDHNTPIVMLLSGGYQKSNAAVIASSLANLHAKFGIFNKCKTAL